MFLHQQKQCGKSGGTPGQKYDESHYHLVDPCYAGLCILYEGREGQQCKCEEVKTLGLSCLTTDHLDNVQAMGRRGERLAGQERGGGEGGAACEL